MLGSACLHSLESLATDSSEVKTYQAEALIRALDKVGVDDPLPR